MIRELLCFGRHKPIIIKQKVDGDKKLYSLIRNGKKTVVFIPVQIVCEQCGKELGSQMIIANFNEENE